MKIKNCPKCKGKPVKFVRHIAIPCKKCEGVGYTIMNNKIKRKKKHKIYEFIIGRFQCLSPHKGHLELIRAVLKEGKNVCIALREADGSEKNPYSFQERQKVFAKIFAKEIKKDKVKIIKIPDIENVVYGRTPGWGIREVRLSKKLESISGTKMREKNRKKNMRKDVLFAITK